jgi:peptidoglycan hydrolase-like protein with peptidoglycan-binding domain
VTKNITRFGSLAILATVGLTSVAFAYYPITSQLDFGARGNNVTNLQTFFADNASIYPEGLVTGYFGGLTRNAVQMFQSQNGIMSSGTAASTGYGRVGPTTLSKINDLINNGGWTTKDMSGPAFSYVSQTLGSSFATFSWNTNEMATGKIFYSTSPVTMNEGDINSVGFGATSGMTAVNDSISRTSQQVTISGLQSNTLYYYVIVATDLTGNVSVFNPNNTFRTQ